MIPIVEMILACVLLNRLYGWAVLRNRKHVIEKRFGRKIAEIIQKRAYEARGPFEKHPRIIVSSLVRFYGQAEFQTVMTLHSFGFESVIDEIPWCTWLRRI